MGGAPVGLAVDAPHDSARPWGRHAAWAALVAAVLCLAGVAAGAPRGFDLSDEGWYWLAARHPLSFVRSSTQFQFPLHDLFDLVGWDVAGARVLRLLLVIVAAAVFVHGVVRFARHRLDLVPTRTTWALLGAAVVVAPFASSWYPPSPSYNDLALMAVLVGVGVLAHAVAAPARPVAVEVVSWTIAGGVGFVLLVVKFSALGALAAMAVAVVVVSWSSWTAARWVIAVCCLVAGVGVAALVWHVRYLSLSRTFEGMRIGLEETSGSIHSPTTLLGAAAVGMTVLVLLALVVGVGLRLDRGRRSALLTLGVLAGIGAVGLANVVLAGTRRSAVAATLVPCALAAAAYLLAPLVATRWRLASSEQRRAAVALAVVMVLLPPLYSFGTANPLLNGATPATVIWLVLLAGGAAWVGAGDGPGLAGLWAPAAVVAAGVMGLGLIWISPYDQVDLRDSTTEITPRSPIADVTLDPTKARSVDDAIASMDQAAGSGPRTLLTFFGLPGLAYATDSTTPGLIFEPDEIDRTEGVIDRACADRRPLFIGATEELPAWVRARLAAACDVDLGSSLRALTTIDPQGEQVTISLLER